MDIVKSESMQESRTAVHLKDYAPPAWLIPEVALTFELSPDATRVVNEMRLKRNPEGGDAQLVLNGERMRLESVVLDGRPLSEGDYELTEKTLTIPSPPGDEFTLVVANVIAPAENTALEGLYMSAGMFCTQNEPEGFRRITYFIDRPDVLSKYTTTIIADKEKFPVLLSNGNPVERADLGDGRHKAVWSDPFAKPTYLFALVAGDLGTARGEFTTMSGRKIALEIHVDKGNEQLCDFALESLKQSMKWDEETFGLEYDLDIYMIVAVEDFNFGAMENKGLNIFNAKLVLADAATATDEAFERIQGVIAHEYFHNWTGNRVTCRDWFQLTLKEGLTVYRDQCFTRDMTSAAVKRIKDVSDLRRLQFPEDAGPMAHPIQPKAYLEINNFYTLTVYEKGAEVIRMIATLIGTEAFRRGIELYFEMFDGRAVTTDDFLHAMEKASSFSLKQFKRWYDYAGTPVVRVRESHDPAEKVYRLTLSQSHGGDEPLLLPVRVSLLDGEGRDLHLKVDGHELRPAVDHEYQVVLHLNETEKEFVFRDVPEKPVPSLLRDFSAPVKLDFARSPEHLAFLLGSDSDAFNRWDAGQQLARQVIYRAIAAVQAGRAPEPDAGLKTAFAKLLQASAAVADDGDGAAAGSDSGPARDPAFLALALTLPASEDFTNEMRPADFKAVHEARRAIMKDLAIGRAEGLLELYHRLHGRKFQDKKREIGFRKLKNRCLGYLMLLGREDIDALCLKQQREADNMTDELTALALFADGESPLRMESLSEFRAKWHANSLVMDNWFAVQASSSREDTLEGVNELRADEVFNLKNPNKVRSLFGGFARNGLRFNDEEGRGYAFIAERILELDPINPGTAAGLTRAFTKIGALDAKRKELALEQLRKITAVKSLSNDVFEIADRCLKF